MILPKFGRNDRSTTTLFSWILLPTSLIFCVGAYLILGFDFFVGVAIGCLVVGLNYIWTVSVVSRAILDQDLRARVLLAYSLKFGLTIIVLFLAILRFDVNPAGILIGVSSLVVASLILVVSRLGLKV